jgi:hypothetical protein
LLFLSFLSFQSFSLIFIFDWFKLLQKSKVENAIYFVFLEICKQKFEATEFEFPALKLLLSPKPFHCLFKFLRLFLPALHCLFTFPRLYLPALQLYLPALQLLFTSPKTFFTCYCFDLVIENGGCWKKWHKAAASGY